MRGTGSVVTSRWPVVGMSVIVAVSACTGSGAADVPRTPAQPVAGQAPPPPPLDDGRAARGKEVYEQYCASCHGADLSGDPNWRTPNPDGSYPPPPHDSSGHTWHHPDRALAEIVEGGSDFPESRMPVFGEILGDEEIRAILEFFKTAWGPEERGFQWQVTWQDSQE